MQTSLVSMGCRRSSRGPRRGPAESRSEEHTSELQSHLNLVCRLLLEKKKCAYEIEDRCIDDTSAARHAAQRATHRPGGKDCGHHLRGACVFVSHEAESTRPRR